MTNNKSLVLRVEDKTQVKNNSEWQLEVSVDGETNYSFGREDDRSGEKILVANDYISRTQGHFIHSGGLWKYQDIGTNKPIIAPRAQNDSRSYNLAKGSSVVLFNGDIFRFGKEGNLILYLTILQN